jgi:hypothetical protein
MDTSQKNVAMYRVMVDDLLRMIKEYTERIAFLTEENQQLRLQLAVVEGQHGKIEEQNKCFTPTIFPQSGKIEAAPPSTPFQAVSTATEKNANAPEDSPGIWYDPCESR